MDSVLTVDLIVRGCCQCYSTAVYKRRVHFSLLFPLCNCVTCTQQGKIVQFYSMQSAYVLFNRAHLSLLD